MSKRIEKTDNYFERVKQRADRTNYRYYLFDYLYFKGEAWGRKWGRMSGFTLLLAYWWWLVVLPGDILLRNSVWSHLRLGYFIAMFLFFCIFILVRYRKARVSALMSHYRRSKTYWHSAVIFPLPAARCAFLLGSMAVRQIGLGGWLEVVTNRIIIHIENIRYGTPDYITAAIRSRSGAGSVLQGVGQESNVAAAQQPENGQLLGT
ncbi:MAG: hypothetical protein ACLVL2_01215 [Bacteroides cellulosilyticus]